MLLLLLLLSLSPQPQLTVVVVKYSSVSLPFFCLTVTSICAQLPFQQLTWHEIGLTTWGGNLPKKGNRTTPKKRDKKQKNFYPALLLNLWFSWTLYKKIQIDRTLSQKQKSEYYIEFTRWVHEFSVTTNLRIFQETEFVYLFLCTTNVNSNIHSSWFSLKKFVDSWSQNSWKLSDEFYTRCGSKTNMEQFGSFLLQCTIVQMQKCGIYIITKLEMWPLWHDLFISGVASL